MLQDRYRLYGILAVAVLFLIVLEYLPMRRRAAWVLVATVAAGLFCASGYAIFLPNIASNSFWQRATALNWQLGRAFPSSNDDGWAKASAVLERSERLGIYRLPQLLAAQDVAFLLALPAHPTGTGPRFQSQPNGGVSGYVLTQPPDDRPLEPTDFAAMLVGGRPLILPREVWRVPVRLLWKQRSLFSDRALFVLPNSVAAVGRYPLYGLSQDGNRPLHVEWTAVAEGPPADSTPLQ